MQGQQDIVMRALSDILQLPFDRVPKQHRIVAAYGGDRQNRKRFPVCQGAPLPVSFLFLLMLVSSRDPSPRPHNAPEGSAYHN
jgi:hypothetical protein